VGVRQQSRCSSPDFEDIARLRVDRTIIELSCSHHCEEIEFFPGTHEKLNQAIQDKSIMQNYLFFCSVLVQFPVWP
jgi:hypothetical protein